MASPQTGDGHIDIANELAEELARTQLNGYESRLLWVIWRKTYGWHKKEDRISNSQFVEATGMKKQHVSRTLAGLLKRNIVTNLGNNFGFQKDYTLWKRDSACMQLPKKVTTEVTYLGNESNLKRLQKLPKKVDTKEKKEKKENTPVVPAEKVEDIYDRIMAAYIVGTGSRIKGISDLTRKNIAYWQEIFDDDDLVLAAEWCKKPPGEFFQSMTLDKLFRQTNKNGSADYIEQILGYARKEKNKF